MDNNEKSHWNKGKRYAKKPPEERATSAIHMRCLTEYKEMWRSAARADKKTLTRWMVENLNRIAKSG